MKTLSLALLAVVAFSATPGLAANVDLQLLNKGDSGAMVFQPDMVKIAVGCQTALKIDPVSASNIDPVMAVS